MGRLTGDQGSSLPPSPCPDHFVWEPPPLWGLYSPGGEAFNGDFPVDRYWSLPSYPCQMMYLPLGLYMETPLGAESEWLFSPGLEMGSSRPSSSWGKGPCSQGSRQMFRAEDLHAVILGNSCLWPFSHCVVELKWVTSKWELSKCSIFFIFWVYIGSS